MLTTNDTTGEKVIQFPKQLNLEDCCYTMTYVSVGVKCARLRRVCKRLVNYIEDTIRKEEEDNVSADETNALYALNTIARSADCNNAGVIE